MLNPCKESNTKRKRVQAIGDEEDDSSMVELSGIPRAPHSQQSSKNGVYFILEKASLVLAHVGKKCQILNPDEHGSYLRRKNLNPYDFRPDIVFEALHEIMNSQLRMTGRLRAVYIRTGEGILIRVEPQARIPENFKTFCKMMAELLQKFSIKSKSKQGKLLRVIQNPVTQHLPINSLKIGLSFSSAKSVQLRDFSVANCDKNLIFVVGVMAHGKINVDYIDDLISVSAYPLSAATCLRRICIATEKQSLTLTVGKDEEKNVEKEGIASNDGLLSNPMVLSPQNLRSPVIFILDNAPLKKGLVGKKWKILNSDEDAQFLLKQKKNLNDYRPDIVHKALLCILDSPLNKAGMVGAIYVKIDQGALFEVKNLLRISRTYERFCGVIQELLQKSSVRAKDTNEVLMRVVDEPVTRHLPVNSHIIGLSSASEKLVDIEKYVSVCSNDLTPVFVVGAMANGNVKRDYVHDYISVSEYPLATRSCLGKICEALEIKWKIW